MDVEAIVSLLEDRLEDIKNNLALSTSSNFFGKLEEYSERLTPQIDDLENWADKVANLLNKYEYTRGLLEGVVTAVRLSLSRGRPEGEIFSTSGNGKKVNFKTIQSGKTNEEKFVNRIKKIVAKAKEVK